MINTLANPPDGLYRRRDTKEWYFNKIELDSPFDLGDSGRLKFRGPVTDRRGVYILWHNFRGARIILRELIIKDARNIYYKEFICEDDDYKEARSALIYIR